MFNHRCPWGVAFDVEFGLAVETVVSVNASNVDTRLVKFTPDIAGRVDGKRASAIVPVNLVAATDKILSLVTALLAISVAVRVASPFKSSAIFFELLAIRVDTSPLFLKR